MKKNAAHPQGGFRPEYFILLGLVLIVAIVAPRMSLVNANVDLPQQSFPVEPTEVTIPATPSDVPTVTDIPLTPTEAPTSTPTTIPCVEPVQPQTVGSLAVYLHCDVRDADEILKVLTFAQSVTPAVGEYHVYGKADLAGAQYTVAVWNAAHSIDNNVPFGEGGGVTMPGLTVIWQGDAWQKYWTIQGKNDAAYLIDHEYQHLVQYEMSGAPYGSLPAWFAEGFAYYIAEQQIIALEGKSTYVVHNCDVPPGLPELIDSGSIQNGACPYVAGHRAATQMMNAKGYEGYYALLTQMNAGSTFASAFAGVYGISLDEFYAGTPLPMP